MTRSILALSPLTAPASRALVLCLAAAALSSGCATVSDVGASMLGPDAVEKVQHRRQAKEIAAIKDAQDVERAAQMCEGGVDKDGLRLKPDLHGDVCNAYSAMMLPVVNTQTSCEEFVKLQPSLLRFQETAPLNAASDARASACKQQFAEAEAAAEADARAQVLASLKADGSREEFGKICKDSKYATELGLDKPSRQIVCDEYVAMSRQRLEQVDCAQITQDAPALYDEAKANAIGSTALESLKEAWLGRAVACKSWSAIFSDLLGVQGYANGQEAVNLLKKVRERDDELVQALYKNISSPDYVVSDLSSKGRASITRAIVALSLEDETVGDCKTLGSMLGILEEDEGKHYVLEFLTARGCEGYREPAEKMLVSEDAAEREFACYYLAKFGDKGSIKKMRTLSYTDSYTSRYTYPVREACRDAYGKLELKLSN